MTPTFDEDGYPTPETLGAIEVWRDDLDALLEYARDAWSSCGRVWEEDGSLKFATGGWSGNEDIVRSLNKNWVFWTMCWQSSHRGGLHVFRKVGALGRSEHLK